MARVWVIRGGEENRLVDDFVAGGVIGVGYPDIPDGRTVDRWDVTELLRSRGWTVPETRAEIFEQFVRHIRPGDVVVMPDTPRREVVFGRVHGDYEFDPLVDAEAYRHRRQVHWFGRHSVDLLPAGVRDLYRQRNTLTERSSAALVEHAAAVERGELGRGAHELDVVAAPRARATTRPPRTSAPRPAPKAAAPSSKPCPACYLVKSLDLFPAGSDVCVDCE